jgi:GH18 family chitinase
MPGSLRRSIAVVAVVLLAATAAPVAAQAHAGGRPYVTVGYFTQWGIYGRNF